MGADKDSSRWVVMNYNFHFNFFAVFLSTLHLDSLEVRRTFDAIRVPVPSAGHFLLDDDLLLSVSVLIGLFRDDIQSYHLIDRSFVLQLRFQVPDLHGGWRPEVHRITNRRLEVLWLLNLRRRNDTPLATRCENQFQEER